MAPDEQHRNTGHKRCSRSSVLDLKQSTPVIPLPEVEMYSKHLETREKLEDTPSHPGNIAKQKEFVSSVSRCNPVEPNDLLDNTIQKNVTERLRNIQVTPECVDHGMNISSTCYYQSDTQKNTPPKTRRLSTGKQKTQPFLSFIKVLSLASVIPSISVADNLRETFVTRGNHKTEYEQIKEDTESFSKDAIKYVLVTKRWKNVTLAHDYKPLNNPLAKFFRQLVVNMVTEYQIPIKNTVKTLDLSESNTYESFLVITDSVFEGHKDVITWGRLISLLSLGVEIALHFCEKGMEEFAEDIVDFVGRHLGERVTPWVQKQGGWRSLYQSFPPENHVDQIVSKALTTTVGILATAAATLYAFR
ncbi:uncharacterized protein LOC111087332 [Limulus polyphemus]|uniref:Uncharacterized protein LOC111087332 n=1 Tax=Limulus polyphemus TaxID=6850 RepID=A0ABM1T0B8_LIMPO|nr:uncharacterized protein LOC111087332 [Limulus polyphemus]XP_022249324.1 uncharacterized protein LOC111087332 [Limulus polyphemus]